MRRRILFHIATKEQYFTISAKEIISHFAVRQNISLNIKNSKYHFKYAKNYFTFGARRIFHLKKYRIYDIIKPSNVTTMLCSVVTLEVGFIDIIAYGTDNFVVFMI